MSELSCILLIDDSLTSNFYNKKVLSKCGVDVAIKEAHNGLEAIEILKKIEISGNQKPNIIFLDINMPVMDGFEFLQEYDKFSSSFKSGILINLLTTSNWSKDKLKAKQNENLIFDYIEKPLNKKAVDEICVFYKNNDLSLK